MGHLKYPLFLDSIENYEKLEKYREKKKFTMFPLTILMCMQNNEGEFDISSKLFLLKSSSLGQGH